LDWVQTESTTSLRNVGRKEGRVRKKVVGRDREEGRSLFTGGRNYNKTMEC